MKNFVNLNSLKFQCLKYVVRLTSVQNWLRVYIWYFFFVTAVYISAIYIKRKYVEILLQKKKKKTGRVVAALKNQKFSFIADTPTYITSYLYI